MRKQLIGLFFLLAPVYTQAQVSRPTTLSDTEKLYGLSTFWSEAKYNFAYFDKAKVNWDSAYQAFIPQVLATKDDFAYYRTLERFCALLKDGHTNVNGPWSIYKFSTYVPLRLVVVDQKPYVSQVLKGLSDNVPVGAELLTVDAMPVRQYLDQRVFPYISASAEHEKWNRAMFGIWAATSDTTTVYPMTFRTPDGQIITFQSRLFSQRERDGSAWLGGDGRPVSKRQLSALTMLPGNIARVELNSFSDEKIIAEFKAMLPQLRTATGVIIDLRQNGGGSTDIGTAILNYFTEQKTLTGSAWRTREHRAAYKAWGMFTLKQPIDSAQYRNSSEYRRTVQTAQGDFWFKGNTNQSWNSLKEPKLLVPTVVVAGHGTASAAEDFLIYVKQLTDRKIPIIGEPSMGTTGQPLLFTLPGGGSARICTKRDTYADGTDFVGIGVLPDITVKPTVADLVRGRDAVLERATTYLQEQIAGDKK